MSAQILKNTLTLVLFLASSPHTVLACGKTSTPIQCYSPPQSYDSYLTNSKIDFSLEPMSSSIDPYDLESSSKNPDDISATEPPLKALSPSTLPTAMNSLLASTAATRSTTPQRPLEFNSSPEDSPNAIRLADMIEQPNESNSSNSSIPLQDENLTAQSARSHQTNLMRARFSNPDILRILIVDDTESTHKILKRILETSFNVEVFKALSGETATVFLSERKPEEPIHIVFMDYEMGDNNWNGAHTLSKILNDRLLSPDAITIGHSSEAVNNREIESAVSNTDLHFSIQKGTTHYRETLTGHLKNLHRKWPHFGTNFIK